LAEAQRLDFTSIWLYDEYNWPSGTCNKKVPQINPDFALKQLCVYEENGRHQFAIRHNPMMTDLMNPHAVDCFIALTHEQYAKHFGQYMGSLLKGIFTDEPDIAYFSYQHQEDMLRLPYYDGIEDDYKAQTGSDLFADIRTGLKNQSEFYQATCNRLCASKFRQNFVEKVVAWCNQYQMILTGHLMNEYSSALALSCNGHPLNILSAFSLPGMDEIFTHRTIGTIEWLTLGTVMYAIEQRGNQGGLAELFALGPCDLTPAQIRRQLWLTAMFGVNHFVMAVAQLDHRGNTEKKYWFNPFTQTQPWFCAYDILGDEAGRAVTYATRQREHRIEVRYPFTPSPLTDILKHLTEQQYAWKLIAPDDQAMCDVVICPENGGIREERTNRFFFDMQTLEEQLLQTIPLRYAWVTDDKDKLVGDVFIRCFHDGECVVLDFSGSTRQLFFHRRGMRSSFTLPSEGVMTFPGWEVTLDHPNTLRPNFVDRKFSFSVDQPCNDLRVAVRNTSGIPQLKIDGVSLCAETLCTELPQGFNEIYLSSATLALAAGDHILELINECEDFPYLPLVWITGTFSNTTNQTITAYKNDGYGLDGYAGTLLQKAKVHIPIDAQQLSIDSQGLGSELKINGVSLGKRLWAPFLWCVPEEYRGTTVTVEILRYTACGKIFGTDAFEDAKAWPWLKTYKPDNAMEIKPFCELKFDQS
jgi:hypothetical protein